MWRATGNMFCFCVFHIFSFSFDICHKVQIQIQLCENDSQLSRAIKKATLKAPVFGWAVLHWVLPRSGKQLLKLPVFIILGRWHCNMRVLPRGGKQIKTNSASIWNTWLGGITPRVLPRGGKPDGLVSRGGRTPSAHCRTSLKYLSDISTSYNEAQILARHLSTLKT